MPILDRYTKENQNISLKKGMNIIGIAVYPDGYTSHLLLLDLGYEKVESIFYYDIYWGEWKSTYWLNGKPAGDEFTISIGEGYLIEMRIDHDFVISRQGISN